MNKSSFFIVGQHAVIEALRNPKRKVLRVFLTEEKVAESVPEKDVGIVTITPGGTLNSLLGAIAPVLVAIGPVVPVPLSNVTPAGAPPPPAEFASAALVIVISVLLSIDAILVSDE